MADMLATAEDLATLLQQDVDTASASMAIELATGVIQDAAGWRLVEESVSGLAVIPMGPVVVLPTTHLTALTMSDAGRALTQGTSMWWTQAGLVTRVWGPLMTPILWTTPAVASFTHGWPQAQVPQQLRALCLAVAARIYDNPTGNRQETTGSATEIKSTGSGTGFAMPYLTAEERTALAPYQAAPVVVST